jgi:hypothetical protein
VCCGGWFSTDGGFAWLSDQDRGCAERAMQAIDGNKKIDLAAMRAASDGVCQYCLFTRVVTAVDTQPFLHPAQAVELHR